MANYRPKSLDELNNLYDRSIAAQTAIQKSGSAIADSDAEEFKEKAVKVDESPALKEKSAAQIASDELAEKLDNFIKSFGEKEQDTAETPAAVQAVPVPITKTVKSAPAKPKTKKATEVSADKKVVQKVSAQGSPTEKEKTEKEKEDEARSLERDELFNDYMRIMNDEDEDGSTLKSKFKKKGKKDKHQGSPLDEEAQSEPIDEKEEETEQDTPLTEEEPLKEKKAKKEKKPKEEKKQKKEKRAKEEKKLQEQADSQDAAEAEELQQEEEILTEETVGEAQPEQENVVKSKSKKHAVAQVLLILMLLGVLCLTMAVGLLKVFVGVDTASPFLEKYYAFTADVTYNDAGINEGDFVITEKKMPAENETLAFIDVSTNRVNFGTRGSLIDSYSYMVHSDSGVSLISDPVSRGVVTVKIPLLGEVVGAAMDNFIIVIVGLVVLALILILILALAFRSSSNYEDEVFDDGEFDEDEADEAYEDEDSSDGYSEEDEEYDEDDEQEDYDEDYGYEEQQNYYDEDDDRESSEDDRLFSIKN